MRNPDFKLHEAIDWRILMSTILSNLVKMCRGFKFLLFGKSPKWMICGKNVKMHFTHKIKWGQFLKLGDGVCISALSTSGVRLGSNVSIGSYSQLITSTTYDLPGKGIKIEDNVGIGEFAYLGGAGGLHIERDCIIGQYFSCHPENHHYNDPSQLIRKQGVKREGIRIADNCWIGSKVTILDGVTIGQGSVIAAGAVVTKSFPENSIIGGVPAKMIKRRIHNNLNIAI